jgi:hypothetical protein
LIPHLPPAGSSASSSSLAIGPGGLNPPLMQGLTAQAAGYHQMGPNLTTAVLLPQQTHGDQRVLLLCPRILPGPAIIGRRQARSNILDESLGGRKRGPDRVIRLDWGFMESTHHTARTVGYSGESCTRRSNRFLRQVFCRCCPSLNLMHVKPPRMHLVHTA